MSAFSEAPLTARKEQTTASVESTRRASPKKERAAIRETDETRATHQTKTAIRERLTALSANEQLEAALREEIRRDEELFAELHGGRHLKAVAEGKEKKPGLLARFGSAMTLAAFFLSGRGDAYKTADQFVIDYRNKTEALAELKKNAAVAAEQPAEKKAEPRARGVSYRSPTAVTGGMSTGSVQAMERRGANELLGAYPQREVPIVTAKEVMKPIVQALEVLGADLAVVRDDLAQEFEKQKPNLVRLRTALRQKMAEIQEMTQQVNADVLRTNLSVAKGGGELIDRATRAVKGLWAQYERLSEQLEARALEEQKKKPAARRSAIEAAPIAVRVQTERIRETEPEPVDEMAWASEPVPGLYAETKPAAMEDVPEIAPEDVLPEEEPVAVSPAKGREMTSAERALSDMVYGKFMQLPSRKLNERETRVLSDAYARAVSAYRDLVARIPLTRKGAFNGPVPAEALSYHQAVARVNLRLGLNRLQHLDYRVDNVLLRQRPVKEKPLEQLG